MPWHNGNHIPKLTKAEKKQRKKDRIDRIPLLTKAERKLREEVRREEAKLKIEEEFIARISNKAW